MSFLGGVGPTIPTRGGDGASPPCPSGPFRLGGSSGGASNPQLVSRQPAQRRLQTLGSMGSETCSSAAAASVTSVAASHGRSDVQRHASAPGKRQIAKGGALGQVRHNSSRAREIHAHATDGNLGRLQESSKGRAPAGQQQPQQQVEGAPVPAPLTPPATLALSQSTLEIRGGNPIQGSSSPERSADAAAPVLLQRPVRNGAAAAAAATSSVRRAATPPQRSVPRTQAPMLSSSTSSTHGGALEQQDRQRPSLRMLLSQQRHRQQQQQQQQQKQAAPALPLQGQQLQARREQPAYLSYSQQRQQQEQHHLLHQQYFRQQQLRVPYWARQLAEQMLQVLAAETPAPEEAPPLTRMALIVGANGSASASSVTDATASATASSSASCDAGLAAFEWPENVLQELHSLLPPCQEQRAQQHSQQQQHQQAQEQQQQQQVEQQARQVLQGAQHADSIEDPNRQHAAEQHQGQQQDGAPDEMQQQGVMHHRSQHDGEQREWEDGPEVMHRDGIAPLDDQTRGATAETDPPPAASGDIFAAELASILSHYMQTARETAAEMEAAAAPKEEAREEEEAEEEMQRRAGDVAEAASGSREGTSSERGQEPDNASAGSPSTQPAQAVEAPRQRRLDEGGFQLLLRAMALMGDGMRSAVALLLAADRGGGGYPTRSTTTLAVLLKLANNLLEDEAALALLRLADEWGVKLDRGMWQNLLDVCAKAGKVDVVERLMKDMDAHGLPPDAVAHTILIMAHEKAGRWQAALQVYHDMRAAGLERNSFTYRALVSALAGADRLSDACEVLDWMAADGVEGNAVVYQTLINAFLERGQQDKVDWLLQRMQRDGVRFSHQAVGRLSGFCFGRGQPLLAFQLFKTAREMGLLSLVETPVRTKRGGSSSGQSDEGEAADKAAEGALTWQPPRGQQGALTTSAPDGSTAGGSLDLASSDDDADSADLGSTGIHSISGRSAGGDGGGSASGAARAEAEAQMERQKDRARAQAAFSYCRMIAACHKARLLEEAWCVYGWMLDDGLRPDRSTYSRLITVCAYSPAHRGGDAEALYERLVDEGVELDAFMYLHLITALGGETDEGGGGARWSTVLRVLHSMHMRMPNYRDTHVQTVAVSVAARQGRLGDALAVYRLMLQDGVQPKAPTFNALIAACMRAGAPSRGFRFFEVMQAMGVQADVVTVSSLIACCDRTSDWQRAQQVWQWMLDQGLEPDTICYNQMISCMERSNQPDRALAVFEQMTDAGVAGSSATYATLCDVFAKQGDWAKLRTAVQVKEWMEGQGEDPAQLTYAELMERASQGGNWKRALDLFDGMDSSLTISGSQPNAVTYSAAIIACARMADWQRAVELKDQMLARGLAASPIVYNSVLAACEAAQQLEVALDLLDEMRVAGVERDQYTYSTLITACYHGEGQLSTALRLFQEMQEEGLTPNTVVLNALLSVCATAGDADAATRVYRHVVGTIGLPPDEITMHCMMEVHGRVGHWAQGLRFFVDSYQLNGSFRGVMQLDLTKPDTAGQLDLHFLSVMGARIVLRAWLLHLKRRALQGQRLTRGFRFCIVTGWGRNSANNVPRLKPEVGRMLQQELGPALALSEPPSNLGVYHVEHKDMYDWLLNHAQLGYEGREEEEAWQLMEQLSQYQRQEQQQGQQPTASPKAGSQQQQRLEQGRIDSSRLPAQYQAFNSVAYSQASPPGDAGSDSDA